MAKIEHYKKKGERENLTRLRDLLDKHGKLRFCELKDLLHVSSPTLSEYIKHLEKSKEIESFRVEGEDRRIQRYRIKPESSEKVKGILAKNEAVEFISSISNPVYVYLKKDEGRRAVAVFASVAGNQRVRDEVRRGIEILVNLSLRMPNTLKASPDKNAKVALVIMYKSKGEEEGAKP